MLLALDVVYLQSSCILYPRSCYAIYGTGDPYKLDVQSTAFNHSLTDLIVSMIYGRSVTSLLCPSSVQILNYTPILYDPVIMLRYTGCYLLLQIWQCYFIRMHWITKHTFQLSLWFYWSCDFSWEWLGLKLNFMVVLCVLSFSTLHFNLQSLES